MSCAASLTKGFKALRSLRREDTPTQYHRSPVRSAGALKESISTPSVASSPKQRTIKKEKKKKREKYSVILKKAKTLQES